MSVTLYIHFFFFQAEDGIRDLTVTGVQTCALPIWRHDLWVISDEVYGQIRYDGSRDSIAALPGMAERTVIVDGFSKGYSMTGWRLGYGVMPARLAEPMTTLVINNVSCTATFVQHAGLAALTGSQEPVDRKSTRLNSSHSQISYAVFCLKKKKK